MTPETEKLRTLLTANRRLTDESAQLRDRISAFERSRWWRLHPRMALHRLVHSRGDLAANERSSVESAVPDVPREFPRSRWLVEFGKEVVERGTFTEDWFTSDVPGLELLLEPLVGTEARILEIGSFEGLSTCFFLWRLRDAHVTAIDTFAGSVEHAGYGSDVSKLEDAFDRNVAVVDASRVRKLVGDSRRVLFDLVEGGARFDIVYVDGSHLALDVLVDACLSWQLLDDGGVLCFDDYEWTGLGQDLLLRPGPAIDAFLQLVAGRHEVLHRGSQLALRRTG